MSELFSFIGGIILPDESPPIRVPDRNILVGWKDAGAVRSANSLG